MPGMVRPLNKATKISFDLLGVPLTLQDEKCVKKFIKKSNSKSEVSIALPEMPRIEYKP